MNRARIITVTSMKGGVGKTEVSVNLAAAIKQKTGRQVVLLDFDIPYGGVSQAFGVDKIVSLSDWIRTRRELNQEQVKNLVLTKSGIDLIPAISSSHDLEQFTGREAKRIIELLEMYYDYIVIDSGVDLSDTTKTALLKANDIVIVTAASNVSLWNNHQYKEDLVMLGVQPEKLNLFVNMVPEKNADIDVQKIIDVYQNYGSRINNVFTATEDDYIRKQRNKGEFVYGEKVKCSFNQAIDELTNKLGIVCNNKLQQQETGGFFYALKQVFAR